MPIYEYVCVSCEYRFDKLEPMASSGAGCPRCTQSARRAISLFSAVTQGDGGEQGSIASMGGCASGACGCACSTD